MRYHPVTIFKSSDAWPIILFFLLLIDGLLGLSGCSEESRETPANQVVSHDHASQGVQLPASVPPALKTGETKFNTFCAPCHGIEARGTNHGPPFVHKIYEPHHHSDFAFQRAAAQGVRAHHWHFGNMPPISGVTPEEVTEIIKYVRWLQRQAGIF